jgi:hypothetical protein
MRVLVARTLVAGSLLVPSLMSAGSSASTVLERDVEVAGPSGAVLTSWPAYDEGIDRFAVRPASTEGGVVVTASSSDATATIRVNGAAAANGEPLSVPDVAPGDEVNVQITDAAGTSNQSWIVVPPGFPELTAPGPRPGLANGLVFLTLASFLGGTYTTLVDPYGVPTYVSTQNGSDFKRAADGDGYSIATPVDSGGYAIRRLDGQLSELGRYRLSGDRAASTDFHDSQVLADGGAVLMGYDVATRAGATWTDAVIEVQDAEGTPTFRWNSKDHVDEESEGLVEGSRQDYAHINSLQRLANGDVLASFRNLSQVMLIAGSAHDGHAAGDVIWRLGGLRNDFTFVADPDSGPCAQHAATLLDDGHLLIFDNGSRLDTSGPIASQTADMCPTPGDPAGPRVARPQSRITEYALDTSTVPPTATLVWSHEPEGRYAPFAGNAQRLPGGNTFAGWSLAEAPQGSAAPVATEVDADGVETWSLFAAPGWFSYRAFKYDAPDLTAPEVAITWPTEGAVVAQDSAFEPDFTCTDAGGSNLEACAADHAPDESLTAQPGTHILSVTATDRAGNSTTRTVAYTVVARPLSPSPTPSPTPPSPTTSSPSQSTAPAAGVAIKKRGGYWRGSIGLSPRAPGLVSAQVRVRNVGSAGRLVLTGSHGNWWSRVRWFAGQRDVTRPIRAGTYRTPRLELGDAVRLRLVVRIRPSDEPLNRVLRLLAANDAGGGKDAARARLAVR